MDRATRKHEGIEDLEDDMSPEQAAAVQAYVTWRVGNGPMPDRSQWRYLSPDAQRIMRDASTSADEDILNETIRRMAGR
jgi:hypothetical protein